MKVVVEEYTPPKKSNGKLVKNGHKFFLPPIPWQWTLYDGLKVVSMGYAHTEDDANRSANQAINQYRPCRA